MSLQQAFHLSQSNMANLLVKLHGEGVTLPNGSVYTAANFVADWSKGGKQFCEQYWRDSANQSTGHYVGSSSGDEDSDEDTERELWQGKHEWIPTNMLGYVVENALIKNSDIRWIYLAEVLRIPTRLVVVNPWKLRYEPRSNPATPHERLGLTGHVGALHIAKPGGGVKRLFKGQSRFHDELRNLLKRWLSPMHYQRDYIHNYVHELGLHLADWYWQGDVNAMANHYKCTPVEFASLPCEYTYNSGVSTYTPWGGTMGDMARVLREGWADWTAVMDNQVKKDALDRV